MDKKLKEILDRSKTLPEFWQMDVDTARQTYLDRCVKSSLAEKIEKTKDIIIKKKNHQIKIRVYFPKKKNKESFAGLIFFHGGGFVIGSIKTHDHLCRRLSRLSSAVIFSVEYRLAPEFKFPSAILDSADAVKWIFENIKKFNVNKNKIGIAGDSAGACIAAVMSILFRKHKLIRLSHQILIYPCTAPKPNNKSHFTFAKGFLLSRKNILWFYNNYKNSSLDEKDFRYAPIISQDLSELPKSLIIVAGYDPLRDEGIKYAEKLIHFGNDVQLINYKNMVHGFFLMTKLQDSRNAIDKTVSFIKECK